MRGKVLIAAPVHPVLTDGLQAAGYELLRLPGIRQEEAAALLHSCTGVITSTRLLLNAMLIDAAPTLRWIGRMGSGMEIIDVPYATAKGIACIGSPEGNCNAVAEHALGLLLGITRRIAHSAAEVADGRWLREENRGTELEGQTIGIIGFGHTGRAFARKLRGMDMRIMVYDKKPVVDAPPYVVACQQPEEIWNEAKILSFHVPFAPDTHHYLNAGLVNQMRNPFILLNTSRGSVVDAVALATGLDSGKIAGAGIDVWEEEPPEKMSVPLRDLLARIVALPQVIVTPHIAGYTGEALYKMSAVLLGKIRALTGL